MELSQDAPETSKPLRDEIAGVILATHPSALAERDALAKAVQQQADAVMHLLHERGHYLPGAPPAAVILRDAQSFAERLTLSNLALRIVNMLSLQSIETPETRPARKWVDDYLEGKNHGPVGKPLLWPVRLPGMASLLRDWGFEPTPTTPAFVARSVPSPAAVLMTRQ